MKKLSILAALLAAGTICLAGCNMQPSSTKTPTEDENIVRNGDNDSTPLPCPDGNCNRDRMPYRKPEFKFKIPPKKPEGNDREKFRRPHKTAPEDPEIPGIPDDGEKDDLNN